MRRGRVPFFGGPLSAALLYLSMEDDSLRHLVWFAMVPLFYSLFLLRSSAPRRFFQGFFCLGLLGLAFFRGDASPLTLGVHCALFAVAAGPILRSPRRLARVMGLPVIWAGLEVFRGPMCPLPGAFSPGWLSLGAALRAGSAESQTASLVGMYGLSFAVATASSLFFNVLVEARFLGQVLFLAAGLAIPVACHEIGARACSVENSIERPAHLTVATEPSGDDERLAALTSRVPGASQGVIIWPVIHGALLRGAGALATSTGAAEAVAKESGAVVITALSESATALRVDPSGSISEAVTGDTPTPPLFITPAGTLAVGFEDDFDSPGLPREAASRHAQLLVSIGAETSWWRESAVRHRSALHAYRAIENGRWIVRASRRAAHVVDPHGHATFMIQGVEGAGAAEAEWLSAPGFYGRRGWWLEPALLAGAGWILVGAIIQWVAHRRKP